MIPREELDLTPENLDVSILVVDDEPDARDSLVEIFAGMGYRAEAAATGQQALELMQTRAFDVALLDIRLPDMRGTDLLSRIREMHPNTKCIMATGYASVDTSVSALNAGAYAYIEKPLNLDKVSAAIDQAVERLTLERQNRALVRELQALRDVTDNALSSLELPEMLRRLLSTVVDHMHATAGAIFLQGEREGTLEVAQSVGLDAVEREQFHLRIGEVFLRQVIEEGREVVIHRDDVAVGNGAPYAGHESGQTVVLLPLRAKGRTIGIACVATPTRREFSPEDSHLLHALADRAAVLIDNARLYVAAQDLAEKQRRSADEARTLYDVVRALVASMEVEERLQTIGEHLTRVTGARRCFTMLWEQDALVLRAVPAEGAGDGSLGERIDPSDIGPRLRAVLDEASEGFIPDALQGGFIESDVPRRWQMRSVLLLPLVYSGKVIGAIGMDEPGELREFGVDERRLAGAIALQAAVAIQNARTFEQERTVARTLQESLLPPDDPQLPGYELRSLYHPASDVMQVGGDYYDFIELAEGRLGIVLGDVCGKGVTAVVFTAMAKYMLRAYVVQDPSPDAALASLNRALYNHMSEDCMFITMVYGVLDTRTGEFTYVNAAHPHPLLYRSASGCFEELATTGGMVGALPQMEFHTQQVRLRPGDVLALFTDGVTEARVGGDMLEATGVEKVMRETAALPAEAIARAIFERAHEHSGGNLKDDVAIAVLKRTTMVDHG
jgi:serine phosphatase RsbU (regulator of sigma subunit)/DNA-binding response OmpR family regulator